jgi:hypothetical protein
MIALGIVVFLVVTVELGRWMDEERQKTRHLCYPQVIVQDFEHAGVSRAVCTTPDGGLVVK